jgi:hypothetical protein
MLASLRDGSWITADRVRTYCLMLLAAYVVATLALFGPSCRSATKRSLRGNV